MTYDDLREGAGDIVLLGERLVLKGGLWLRN